MGAAHHHPIFKRYRIVERDPPEGMVVDSFLGTIRRSEFVTAEGRPGYVGRRATPGQYPEIDDEYFEWIDLLCAVAAADSRFTFVELGAGYGRWSVRAAAAAMQAGITDLRLIAVEADPTHYAWLHTNFSDNGLDARGHTLIHSAVDASVGRAHFAIAEPGVDYACSPGLWYGQSIYTSFGAGLRGTVTAVVDTLLRGVPVGNIGGARVSRTTHGWKTVLVSRIRLDDVLRGESLIDLLDCDVQGVELRLFAASIDTVDRLVRRLHIATHSTAVEAGIRALLTSHGWRCAVDHPFGHVRQTPFGRIAFQDGVQSWLNPRLT